MAENLAFLLTSFLRSPAVYLIDSYIKHGLSLKNASVMDLIQPLAYSLDALFYGNSVQSRTLSQAFILGIYLVCSFSLLFAKPRIVVSIYLHLFLVFQHFFIWICTRTQMNHYELQPQWKAYLQIAPGTSLLILQFLYVAYFTYASILILNHHFALTLKTSLLAPLVASFLLPTVFTSEHTILQLADLFGSLGFLLLTVIFLYKTKQSGRKHFLFCMLSDLYSMINELGLLEFLLVVWKRYHLTTQIICYWIVNLAAAVAIAYPSSYFDFIYCVSITSFSSLCNIIGLTLFLNRSFHRLLAHLNHWGLALHPRLTEAPTDITNDSTGLFYDSSTNKNAPFFFGWFEFAIAMSLSSSFHQSPNKNLRISHLYTVALAAFAAFLELSSETFEGRLQNSTQREPLSQHLLSYLWQIVQLYWNFLIYGLLLLFALPLGVGITLMRLFHLDYLSSSTDISHFIALVLIVSLFLVAAKTAFHIMPKIFVHASGGELAELDLGFCVKAYRNHWGPVMTTNFIAKNRSLLLFSTAFLYVFLEIMVHTLLFVSLVIGQYLDSEVEVDHETQKSTSVSKLVNIEPIDFVFLPLYAHLKIWVGIERLCTLWRDFSAARTRFAALQPLSTKELDGIFEAGSDEGSLCAICYSSYLATSDYTFSKNSTFVYSKDSSVKLEKCLKNLVDETIRKTPCQHIFHANCIRRWLYFKPCCPLCIQPIGAVTPPSSNPNDLAAVLARSSQERFYTASNRNSRVYIRGREVRVRPLNRLTNRSYSHDSVQELGNRFALREESAESGREPRESLEVQVEQVTSVSRSSGSSVFDDQEISLRAAYNQPTWLSRGVFSGSTGTSSSESGRSPWSSEFQEHEVRTLDRT